MLFTLVDMMEGILHIYISSCFIYNSSSLLPLVGTVGKSIVGGVPVNTIRTYEQRRNNNIFMFSP